MNIMVTLTRKEHSLIKLVSRVITNGLISDEWLLLETHYSLGLMNVDYANTDS